MNGPRLDVSQDLLLRYTQESEAGLRRNHFGIIETLQAAPADTRRRVDDHVYVSLHDQLLSPSSKHVFIRAKIAAIYFSGCGS